MRIFSSVILVAIAFAPAFSQTKVDASEIIRQINAGRSVSFTDAEIVGDLDLTDLRNRRNVGSSNNWFGSDSDLYESTVEESVSFVNCTFQGDVIAYYNNEWGNDTFIAHFEGDAIFKNCTFRRASEFKYSEFSQRVDFSGSVFNHPANFKYAEFQDAPTFANTRFEDDADFKYTEFPRGTSFSSATFYGLANFKYTKFRTPLDIANISFRGQEDFKYTKVDGRSFTSYLLENR
jgi:uncharacterized protein YjbI with pentapeptide repeats